VPEVSPSDPRSRPTHARAHRCTRQTASALDLPSSVASQTLGDASTIRNSLTRE